MAWLIKEEFHKVLSPCLHMCTERFWWSRQQLLGGLWGAMWAGDFGHTSWEKLVDEGDTEVIWRSSPPSRRKRGWRAFVPVDLSYNSLWVI